MKICQDKKWDKNFDQFTRRLVAGGKNWPKGHYRATISITCIVDQKLATKALLCNNQYYLYSWPRTCHKSIVV